MKTIVINPSIDVRWNKFVEKHPLGCVFHHSAWKEVVEKTFPQVKPLYLVVEDTDGRILGGAPFFLVKSWLSGSRLVSLPFSLYCDPLVDSQKIFKLLVETILWKQRELGISFVEVRTRFTSGLFQDIRFKEFRGYKNHTLSLDPDLEILKKSFHRTCVRQRINRAKKSNLTVMEASSEADMWTFYQLHCMTRKKYGIPPQPYQFFRNMWEILYPQKMLGVLIARYGNQSVSALLFLKYKKRIHAEYIGTDATFLNYSPNILLFWKAIQKSKADGYKYFDFGGSYANNIPLINFKKRWGTVEEEISYYYIPDIKGLSAEVEKSKKYRILTQVSCKLPDRLFRWMGHFLYYHLGG